jgi:hypothetical protein
MKRTVERVLASTGLPENEATVRMVASCFVNIAAEYVKVVGDDPEHIEKLFHAFLTGNEDEQRAAVKEYGEAFLRETNEDAAVAHVTPHVELFPESNKKDPADEVSESMQASGEYSPPKADPDKTLEPK